MPHQNYNNRVEILCARDLTEQIHLKELVLSACNATFDRCDKKGLSLNVKLMQDEEMKLLNFKYNNENRATDVLSFSNDDEANSAEIGDIAINVQLVAQQSQEKGCSFEQELCRITIHGGLHLLGYDHYYEEERRVMFDLTEEILAKIL